MIFTSLRLFDILRCSVRPTLFRQMQLLLLYYLHQVKEVLSLAVLEEFVVMLWRIWFKRNTFILTGRKLGVEEVVDWSKQYLLEIKDLRGDTAEQGLHAVLQDVRWNPPSAGLFKMNVDGTVCTKTGKVGLGFVIRDYLGQVMLSAIANVQQGVKAPVAEALALRYGMQLAVESDIRPCSVESDASALVRLINFRDQVFGEILGLIVDDTV